MEPPLGGTPGPPTCADGTQGRWGKPPLPTGADAKASKRTPPPWPERANRFLERTGPGAAGRPRRDRRLRQGATTAPVTARSRRLRTTERRALEHHHCRFRARAFNASVGGRGAGIVGLFVGTIRIIGGNSSKFRNLLHQNGGPVRIRTCDFCLRRAAEKSPVIFSLLQIEICRVNSRWFRAPATTLISLAPAIAPGRFAASDIKPA